MKQIKSLVQDIHKGINLERNLNRYQEIAVETYEKYATLELTFSAFTMMQEMVEEKPDLAVKEKRILDIICQVLSELGSGSCQNTEIIEKMTELRQEITDKMDLFTAYTDRLICYEYVLNRMELNYMPVQQLNEQLAAFDDNEFNDQLMRYVFYTKDKSVQMDKIRLITSQIPVHMTKSKLFEKIEEAFSLYKNGLKMDLDQFIYMLRTAAMLYEPKHYVGEYPSFEEVLKKLEKADYVKMSEKTYNEMLVLLEHGAKEIHTITDFYYSMQKVVNSVYALCLMIPYQMKESSVLIQGRKIWTQLAKRSYKDEMLIPLEGEIEKLVKETSYLESVLFEIKSSYTEQLKSMNRKKCFDDMGMVANLLSDSLFIDLDQVEQDEVADAAYVQNKAQEMMDELSEKLAEISKPVKKAVMSQILEKMPTLFHSPDEFSEYVGLNLLGCQNKAEKCIVMSMLSDLMQEEQEW